MNLDDELCLCFHVTKRKVLNYLRIEQPKRLSQLANCQGAGTGCGWCRPFLKSLFENSESDANLPSANDYASSRADYIKAGKGTPPST